MPSPYVIIDANFTMNLELASSQSSLQVETSVDGGKTWTPAGRQQGPFHGPWHVEPKVLVKSAHGRLTAVSGSYGYKVRITRVPASNDPRAAVKIDALHLVSRIQVNPRSLPAVSSGQNRFTYAAGPSIARIAVPAPLSQAPLHDLELITENGQQFLRPLSGKVGQAIYALDADSATLTGFEAGARFLDLSAGLAPDKLTAETRHTSVTTRQRTGFPFVVYLARRPVSDDLELSVGIGLARRRENRPSAAVAGSLTAGRPPARRRQTHLHQVRNRRTGH